MNILTLRRNLQLKRQGTRNRQIALNCDLSRDTVDHYVHRIIACSQSIDTLLEFDDETLAGILMSPPVAPQAD